ncbi:hypothetical protein KFU94_47470 [Chloroflexi bacterium TSY]|nr:hypothetical protein [Chloroflexi bacterium TSY]
MATEERRYDQHAAFAQALDHLCDALEIVDWRSGEIRNPATAQWYLEETLTRMATIDHYRVQKWSKTLRNHQHQLLTALDWLNSALEPLRTDLRQHCPTAELTLHFERTVARTWRLQQALINGHQRFQSLAQQAQDALDTLIYQMPVREQLAQQITAAWMPLVAPPASSSVSTACLSSSYTIVVPCLTCPHCNAISISLLWHNMRLSTGKRQGLSPYQIAGIDTDDTDWLTLLGYPDV